MQPQLVHYCTLCTYNTTVPFSASVFSQNQTCAHCGAVSTGINVRGKQEEEANMQQDELARLFSANLNLSQNPPPSQPEHVSVDDQQQREQVPAASTQPITYASQHYTHTHHVVPIRHIPPPQSTRTQIDAADLEAILLRNSIDPSLLFPSQVDLFQNADDDQRLRLLELWRISPPQGRQGSPAGPGHSASRQLYDWPPTSLAQEEAMAKLRYERMMEEQAQSEEIRGHEQQLDQSMDEGTGSESAAVLATRGLLTASSPEMLAAEPYIVSGYDMLARRDYEDSALAAATHLRESTKYNQATDPAYAHSAGGLWTKNAGSIADMENQYGAFAHAREHDVQPIYADDDMVM